MNVRREALSWLFGTLICACSGVGAQDEPQAVGGPDEPSEPGRSPSQQREPGEPIVSPVGGPGSQCQTPKPGAAPLRRLTNAEYRNTMVDLVGEPELVDQVVGTFPREPTSLGFRTSAQALTITPLVADVYVEAAQALAPAAIASEGVVSCDLDSIDGVCVEQFVESFGKRVYRRPLTATEVARYATLYDTIVSQASDKVLALQWIATAMFSSPHFLFRVELSAAPGGGVSRPTNYEMATRLSYLLWQTMPDDELFVAADAGELVTRDGIEQQVHRMATDPKALRVYEFFEQWLDLDEAEAIDRSEGTYPEYDDKLRQLLQAENRAFIQNLLVSDGTFSDLLAADYTYANEALATHYGLPEVPSGGKFVEVPAPGRAGVLTQATLLVHDRTSRSSIVKRGLKIRTDFLCQIVPAPPADVDTTLPELDGDLTQRQRLERHREDPSCVGCHSLMDPIGEIFEDFDALGRMREVDEGGAMIVSGGSILGSRTLDGDYANASELAQAMAESDEVRECFALQAFRFFYGRDVTNQDDCTRQQLMSSFARNDYRLGDLLIGLTQSDQFLYRNSEAGEP